MVATLSDFNLGLIDFAAPNGCWTFTRHLNAKGYSKIAGQSGHRLIWRLFVGPIDDGLDLDHLCGNRACVNPDHLEPVSHTVNIRRVHGWTLDELGRWHCRSGHIVEGDNAYIKSGGRVECKPCRNERSLAYYYRKAPR